jgi:lysophospholipase L1-like esterase
MVVTDSPRNGPSALLRLNQDVLQRKGLRHVIVLEGINDIRGGANAADIIAAYQQIIDRVHAKGAKIYGGTILAFKGTSGYTAAKEEARAAVNTGSAQAESSTAWSSSTLPPATRPTLCA